MKDLIRSVDYRKNFVLRSPLVRVGWCWFRLYVKVYLARSWRWDGEEIWAAPGEDPDKKERYLLCRGLVIGRRSLTVWTF